jgi:hypothetical protein
MLSSRKQARLLESLRKYARKYLSGKITALDEPGTRLVMSAFLTDVLGYAPHDEIKTEFMIKGTYADFVIQLNGKRHFIIEVKPFSLSLIDAHLRPAIDFGANEGIDWVMLTNGRIISLYKILYQKPTELRELFTIDLADKAALKNSVELIHCVTREGIVGTGLDALWNKHRALDPVNVAGMLYGAPVLNFLKKALRAKYKQKFFEEEIISAIDTIITSEMVIQEVKKSKKTKSRVTRISVPVMSVHPDVDIDIPNPLRKPLPVFTN